MISQFGVRKYIAARNGLTPNSPTQQPARHRGFSSFRISKGRAAEQATSRNRRRQQSGAAYIYRASAASDKREGLLTLRPPGEDELLERGDGGAGVVLAGPDVGAVEEPELHLDRLLPAGHPPWPDRGRRLTNPHQPLLHQRSPRLQEQPPRQEQGIGGGNQGWGGKGCRKSAQEGQAPMRIPRRIRSSARGFRIASRGAKRGGDGGLEAEGEGGSGIRRRFGRYTLRDLGIYDYPAGILVGTCRPSPTDCER
jgi:hypothetical protein